jgi:hypothetical protein
MYPEIYIYTSDLEPTTIETGDFDDFGVVEEVVEGFHSLFALKVTSVPSFSEADRERGLSWKEWAWERLYQQIQFIASLHQTLLETPSPNPSLRSFDLRYASSEGQVEIILIAKTFDSEQKRSRELAFALSRNILALFPKEYGLEPISSEEDFRRFCLPEKVEHWLIGEIRRYEEFVPLESERHVREENYLVYPFTWTLTGMGKVMEVLASCPSQAIVSVCIRPTRLYEAEERHLCDLYASFEKLGEINWLKSRIQGQIGMKIYSDYLRQLKRPFLMRVRFAWKGTEPDSLIQALGSTLAAFNEDYNSENYFDAPYEVAFPEDELEVARYNFRLLEFESWGNELSLPKYRRFRYLVDARGANSAFRIPILGFGGERC